MKTRLLLGLSILSALGCAPEADPESTAATIADNGDCLAEQNGRELWVTQGCSANFSDVPMGETVLYFMPASDGTICTLDIFINQVGDFSEVWSASYGNCDTARSYIQLTSYSFANGGRLGDINTFEQSTGGAFRLNHMVLPGELEFVDAHVCNADGCNEVRVTPSTVVDEPYPFALLDSNAGKWVYECRVTGSCKNGTECKRTAKVNGPAHDHDKSREACGAAAAQCHDFCRDKGGFKIPYKENAMKPNKSRFFKIASIVVQGVVITAGVVANSAQAVSSGA